MPRTGWGQMFWVKLVVIKLKASAFGGRGNIPPSPVPTSTYFEKMHDGTALLGHRTSLTYIGRSSMCWKWRGELSPLVLFYYIITSEWKVSLLAIVAALLGPYFPLSFVEAMLRGPMPEIVGAAAPCPAPPPPGFHRLWVPVCNPTIRHRNTSGKALRTWRCFVSIMLSLNTTIRSDSFVLEAVHLPSTV